MKEFTTSAPITDSTIVSFNDNIHPIMVNNHCFDCHSPNSGVAGAPDWTNFTNFQNAATQKYNSTDPGPKLYMRIHSSDPGFRMPRDLPALSVDEIHLIDLWIKQGAPNN